MIKFVTSSLLGVLLCSCFYSCQPKSEVTWLDIIDLQKEYSKKAQKAMVFIYDPSCGTCDSMRLEAFSNTDLNEYLSDNFYISDLSIAEQRPIFLGSRQWQAIKDLRGMPYHELAASLSYSKDAINTPAIAFLDEKQQLIVPIKKKIDDKQLELLASYIIQEEYLGGKSIDQFEQQYSYRFQ